MGSEILAITETKKKGQGLLKLGNKHILKFTGVQEDKRAETGAGCILHERLRNQLHHWKA